MPYIKYHIYKWKQSDFGLTYLFRMKPSPKSKNLSATNSDYLPKYFQAGLSDSVIVFITTQEQLLKSDLGNNYLPHGNG
jgi:hypothetical protein